LFAVLLERDKIRGMTIRIPLLIFSCAAIADAQNPKPKVFAGAKVEEVYRVVLDRDALLLEAIHDVIEQHNIREGQVMITAGSLQECTFHYVTSTSQKPKDEFKTVKGPFEILSGGGMIAGGQPHIHIAIAERGQAAVGGHLERGCKILYLGEITIVKYAAPSLIRRPNANGIMMLQEK